MTCGFLKNLKKCILSLRIHILCFTYDKDTLVSVVREDLGFTFYVTDMIDLDHCTVS